MKSILKSYLLSYATALSCLTSCMNENSKYPLAIVEIKLLDSIPSASGIVLKNETAYIIGDDASGIYKMSLRNYQQQKIPIKGLDFNEYREQRKVKHDFECASLVSWKGDEYLLALGSGSSSPERDSMLMVRMSELSDSKIISLQNFYSKLQVLTQTNKKEWNIEAITATKDLLILFNRGNNLIIKFKLDHFMSYLFDANAPFPAIEHHRVKLPFIENFEARLSGACTLDDFHLLFSASVEDTRDWTIDGPVFGSFIGVYSLTDNQVVTSYILQDEKGVALKEKIESLDILRNTPGDGLVLIAISDNDNGTSNLFRMKLHLPN